MSNSQYRELDQLIKEYEQDYRTIKSDRLIMKNYPKVFTMSAASSFEHQLKCRCKDFLDSPNLPLQTNYPKVFFLQKKKKPVVDQMFTKLKGYEDNGIECLNAQEFYDLLGGATFQNTVEQNYESERTSTLQHIEGTITVLSSLLEQDSENEQYAFDYAKQSDLKEQLECCSFSDAEKSYLSLKLRRNRVAHNYIDGLSDTFEDIQKFYNTAVLYVIALETSIIALTQQTT